MISKHLLLGNLDLMTDLQCYTLCKVESFYHGQLYVLTRDNVEVGVDVYTNPPQHFLCLQQYSVAFG